MSILVSDTSVLIDLERAHLLDEMFLLPFQFVVPDLLYKKELAGPFGNRLKCLGLRVEELTHDEVSRATRVKRQYTKLSVPDTFAFAIAEARRWGLLTGDSTLRDLAIAEQVDMHGVLWVFDQLSNGAHVSFGCLHTGLSNLSRHPRCRLPQNEIQNRLAYYVK